MSDTPTATQVASSGARTSTPGLGLAPGQAFADRYRVVALLGRGGMGEVYRVDDLKLGLAAALKLLPERMAGSAPLEQFHAEVRLAREVTHPNVCRVFDIGECAGRHYLTMEYVDGEDLASLLRRIGRLPHEKALDIAHQLCAGLAAAHARGVLHRDLKPANVMLDGRGQVRIMDFGLALRTGQDAGGTVAGTPAYMAPEQFEGRGLSVRTDVYALGLILYELFTGRRTFAGDTLEALAHAHRTLAPPAPSQVLAGLDPAIEAAILTCLAKDPAARPASARGVAALLPGGDALAVALAAGHTPSPEMVAAAGESGQLRPAAAGALAAGTLLATLLGAGLARDSTLVGAEPLVKPPDALADRGRELAKALGYPEPVDTAQEWTLDVAVRDALERRRAAGDRGTFLYRPAFRFAYRESTEPLEAARIARRETAPQAWILEVPGRVTRGDPPLDAPGAIMEWSPTGRLLAFAGRPGDAALAAGRPSPDWAPLLEAAGLSAEAVRPVPPREWPEVASDTRAAWEGGGVRVEAASLAGIPVRFRVEAPGLEHRRGRFAGRSQAMWVFAALAALVVGGALALARRNLRQQRGDPRGAWRVAGAVFACNALAFLLGASHVTTLHEVYLLTFGFSRALWLGAIVWVMYLALEPHVRRLWPQMLIGWSRLLAGRIADPLVGRDLLVGLLAGCGSVLVPLASARLGPSLGLPPRLFLPEAESLLSAGPVTAWHLSVLSAEAMNVLSLALLLIVARLALRREAFAAAAVTLLLTGASLGAPTLYVLVPVAVQTAVQLTVLVRYGLIAGMACGVANSLADEASSLVGAPPWVSAGRVIPLALLALLALHGWRAAVGGAGRGPTVDGGR